MSHRARIASAALVLSGALGCATSESASPTGRPTLSSTAADLTQGSSLTLSSLGAPNLRWTSRDTNVVGIGDGSAIGRLPGETYLVAANDDGTDSIHVVVHFVDLGTGDVGLRVGTGPAVTQTVLKGWSLAIRDLADSNYISRIAASTRGDGSTRLTQPGESLLWVAFDTQPVVGAKQVAPFTVSTVNGISFIGNSGAAVELADSASTEYYVAVSPATLEITSLTMPSVPTLGNGTIAGRVSFQAAGLSVNARTGAITPIGNQVVPVFAEFTSSITHAASSVVTLTFGQFPFAGSVLGNGSAFLQSGVVQLRTGVVAAQTMLTLPTTVGTYTPSPSGPAWISVTSPATDSTPTLTGTPTGGTFSIRSYTAPTATTWGSIRGSFNVTLRYDGDPSRPAHTGTLTVPSFALTLEPTSCNGICQ